MGDGKLQYIFVNLSVMFTSFNRLNSFSFRYFPDDVIRRRLLIDGDGTGDDRRLNVLLKTLIKWCKSTDEKPEERLESQYKRNYLFFTFIYCFS